MFLCNVACNDWLEQIYPDDILLLHAILCHIWRGRSIRPERSEDDLLTVIVFCMTV